jgi:tetratricopeptide (TPR) repeat protein
MRAIGLLFIFLWSSGLFAQQTDQQLAQYYYGNGEFAKAVTYYEKLFAKDPTKIYFLRYYDCLMQTGATKEAEKMAKKQASVNPNDPDFFILLAEHYEQTDQQDKAEKMYAEKIGALRPDPEMVIGLFNAFRAKGKTDRAQQTLERGRKLLKNDYPLHLQFAELYNATGQKDKMIEELLDLLDNRSDWLENIQLLLGNLIDFSASDPPEYELLKTALLERIQKKPNDPINVDMLVWLFMQKRNFSAALTQLQALDKRLKEGGRRVMELGRICIENNDYAVARKSFKYVMEQGPTSYYYNEAESALLNARFLEVTTNRNYSQEEIAQTIQEYNNTLNRIGKNPATMGLILELSYIQAFYGNEITEAIKTLEEAMTYAGTTDIQKAEIKMQLADIQVLNGDIWEASLLYMQIDSDFKFEPIGHEAKYKNARIFYYDGEFDYAQSQLNVLKESTSRLIANDAMQLSILITDNFGLDSNYQAMTWFANADLLIERHLYQEAFQLFDSISSTFPYHSLNDEMLFRKSKAMQQQGNWLEAIKYLELLLKNHGDDILADDALFQLGDINEHQLNDKEKAAEYYKTILFDYKGSLHGVEARKRFRMLRGDKAISEEEGL